MWGQQNPPTADMSFGNSAAAAAAATQQQQQQQHQQQQQQQQIVASNQTAAQSAADPHNYNIGSVLTNLIDNNPNTMEYNFELMQPGASVGAAAAAAQQQQQQQNHANAATPYGLQPTAAGLMRHTSVYGAPTASIYDAGAQHVGLGDLGEQQKNSFQPYHSHLQLQAPTAHHPLAATSHLLPPPPHGHGLYDRTVGAGGYSLGVAGVVDEGKTVLPPISNYMHHMHQQQQQQMAHGQQPDMVYYPLKNE